MATPVVVGQAYRLSFTIKSYDKEGDFSDSQNSSTGNPLATIAYLNKNIRAICTFFNHSLNSSYLSFYSA